jgi:hypothetical protein
MTKMESLELPAGQAAEKKLPPYRDPVSTNGASVFQLLEDAKDGSS